MSEKKWTKTLMALGWTAMRSILRFAILSSILAFGVDGVGQKTIQTTAHISSVHAEPMRILVRGTSLARVELWARATGIDVPEVIQGKAKLRRQKGTAQEWVYNVPRLYKKEGWSISELSARAWDAEGHAVRRKYLMCGPGVCGVQDINNQLFGPDSLALEK